MIDHELAIVLAKRAFDRAITGVRTVGGSGPLPDDSERIVEMPGAGGDFPFHFSRQMLAGPTRERVRLIIADVTNRSGRIERLQPGQCHDLPFTIDLPPMPRRGPSFVAERCKSVHEPECWRGIAAVLDEREPFGVGDKIARQLHGTDQCAMRRFFIVEVEAIAAVSDGMDAFAERSPAVTGSH